MARKFCSTNYTNGDGYTNTGRQSDNSSQRSNPAAREFQDYSVQQETASSSDGKKKGRVFRTLFTAAAASVAAVTILPIAAGPAAEVRFEYLNATDTVLEYVLSIEYAKEDEEISILIVTPNGNTVNEQLADAETVAGTVTGLNAGARYDIVVKSGSTLTSRSVTMAEKRTTRLNSVDSLCQCAVDGTFHFRVDFIDENGYWSDFRATLTDAFGNSSECDFSDAPTEEHTLTVQGAGMRGDRALLRIVCMSTAPDENGNREAREFVLSESTINI